MLVIEILKKDAYYKDGDKILDVDNKTESKSNLVVSELTELSSLRVSTFVSTSVPNTPKNVYLLLAFEADYRIPVRVKSDDAEYPIYQLYWTSYDEKDIQINFIYEERSWAEQLKDLKLNAINYWKWGTLTLNQSQIEDNWANGFRYVDETAPIYLAPAIYNCIASRIYQTNEVDFSYDKATLEVLLTPSDLRPLVSPLFVCKEMFAKIGYQFKSPFLESDFGRELWTYILADDFGSGYGGQQYKFRMSFEQTNAITEPVAIQQQWVFMTDAGSINTLNYDPASNTHLDIFPQPNGFPNPSGYWENTFTHPTKWNFTAVFKGLRHNHTDKAPIKCVIDVYDMDGTAIVPFDRKYLEPVIEQGEVLDEVIVTWENAVILPNQRVRLLCFCDQDGITADASINYGTSLEGHTSDYGLHYKDEVRFKVKEDSCFDYLNGVTHMIKGKLLVDYPNRTVTLYPTENTHIFGYTIEGYYKELSQELDTYSPKVSRNLDKYKEVRVGYKQAQYLNTKEGDSLFTYDGNDAHSGTIDYINPYFHTVKEGKAVNNANLPNCPNLVYIKTADTKTYENSEQVFSVSPFIVKAYGHIELSRHSDLFKDKRYYEYEEDFTEPRGKQKFVLGTDTKETPIPTYFKIPYVSQNPVSRKMNDNHILPNISFINRAKSLAYYFYNNDLFNRYVYEFLALGINPSFIISSVFFRYPIKSFINGNTKTLRATDVIDYQPDLPIVVKAKDIVIKNDFYDSYWVSRVYRQPLTPADTSKLDPSYLISMKIDGVEQLVSAIPVNTTPITKTISGIAYIDNWIEVLGLYVKAEFYFEGSQNDLIKITMPKGIHFSATFSKSNDPTSYVDYIWRFESDGTFYNAHEGSINYALMVAIDLGENTNYYQEFKKVTQ